MQVRKSLVEAMQRLKGETIEMAELTLELIKEAFQAFQDGDVSAAKNIMKKDDLVDQFEEKIAKHALKVIWREQPVASDLRLVTGILKMITDIERIGDHASDIAYMTTFLKDKMNVKLEPIAREMMKDLENMYLMTIQALEMNNEALAQKVIEADESVNKGYKKALKLVTDLIKKEEIDAESAVHTLMILKYLEKVGDHAGNIAEWIIFTLTGIHKTTELY
jgi:phosphate transport system protein